MAFADYSKLKQLLAELTEKLEAGQTIAVTGVTLEATEVSSAHHGPLAFARLLKFEPEVGDELRAQEDAGFRYHGVAADGTATSSATWRAVRFTKSGDAIVRVQYRTGVAWDDVELGWS